MATVIYALLLKNNRAAAFCYNLNIAVMLMLNKLKLDLKYA